MRLARLVRVGLVVTVAAVVADMIDGDASEPSAARVASVATPMTIRPLPPVAGRVPVITRVDTTDPVVFLTIDDGHARSDSALTAFEEAGVPATLFLLNGPIAANADFFLGMSATLVESHTTTHPDLRTLSEEGQRAEICDNADAIENAFGRRPVLFRPPFGAYDEATRRSAAACGMRAMVLWEQTVSGDVIGFRHQRRFRAGDIILMHLGPTFVEELRLITERVAQAGLRFALLEDYLVPESVPA